MNDHKITQERVSGRRPLKSRSLPVFQKTASWLARTSVTPNMISGSSMLFAGLAAAAMVGTAYFDIRFARAALWLAAAAMMQCRLIANLLDGMVAVEGGKGSAVGDLYNEVPDRVSDSLIFLGAGFAAGGISELGLGAAVVAVFVAYVRAIGASVDAGQCFAGPMAKPQRMAVMTMTAIMLCAMNAIPFQLEYGPWVLNASLSIVIVGSVVTSFRRLRFIARHLHATSGMVAERFDTITTGEKSRAADG